jgi:hypothetical protein
MYLNPNGKKLSDQCAFICKEMQQIWFLAMQLCRILHDTHSVLYLLQCWVWPVYIHWIASEVDRYHQTECQLEGGLGQLGRVFRCVVRKHCPVPSWKQDGEGF